jgi:hypothetical protein
VRKLPAALASWQARCRGDAQGSLARISHQELATALKRGGFDWFTAR